jgi:hypothetical protein
MNMSPPTLVVSTKNAKNSNRMSEKTFTNTASVTNFVSSSVSHGCEETSCINSHFKAETVQMIYNENRILYKLLKSRALLASAPFMITCQVIVAMEEGH